MRIGVLFEDGSINVMSERRGDEFALKEARAERDRWNKDEAPAYHAKVVSIDFQARDMVELRDGDE